MTKKYVTIGVVLSGLVIALCLPVYQVIQLLDEQGNVIHTFKWKSDELKIGWKHSVELTPWEEVYHITAKNKLAFVETKFQSYGAGTPDTDGEVEFLEDGFIRVTGIQREIPTFSLYYVPFSEYYIKNDQTTHYLEDYVNDYSSVEIKPQKVSLFTLLMSHQ